MLGFLNIFFFIAPGLDKSQQTWGQLRHQQMPLLTKPVTNHLILSPSQHSLEPETTFVKAEDRNTELGTRILPPASCLRTITCPGTASPSYSQCVVATKSEELGFASLADP